MLKFLEEVEIAQFGWPTCSRLQENSQNQKIRTRSRLEHTLTLPYWALRFYKEVFHRFNIF